MLRTDGISPVCRAEHRSFYRGSAEGQEPLLLTLDKSEERRKQAATGSPFLWLLSFGEAKESNSPSGATTRFNQVSR